jgi:hypothetical protein
MSTKAAPRSTQFMAWTVVVLAVVLILLGFVWYGFSADVHNRIWHNIAERPGGPMSFRFLLQPAMAAGPALWTTQTQPFRSACWRLE